MVDVLDDRIKFKTLDNVGECDQTATEEQCIQRELLGFYCVHLIPKRIYAKKKPRWIPETTVVFMLNWMVRNGNVMIFHKTKPNKNKPHQPCLRGL